MGFEPDTAAEYRGGREPALTAQGITKAFPGVLANDRVDFEIGKGEIHGLLGENGSGKTTLCKVLTGFYRPDAGQILTEGSPVQFRSPADAFAAGIFMVHQHFSLVDTMTVAENVVLGWSLNATWRFDKKSVEAHVSAAGEKFDIRVDPRALISTLSVGEKQKVELLKALYRGARTLILDEPTTVLTPQEADQLFNSLKHMAKAGGAVIFISHKLDEVSEICDRVTVLRQGRTAGLSDLRRQKVDARGLARLMVGRDIQLQRKASTGLTAEAGPVLEIDKLNVFGRDGAQLLKNISLTVRRGEVLGVAGVAGNGQLALAEAITGLRARRSGDVRVGGASLPSGNVKAAIDRGVAYIPENRLGTGLAPGLKVSQNIALKSYRDAAYRQGPFMRNSRIQDETRKIISQFSVKGNEDTLISQLSGGNAQKILVGRELASEPVLLVVCTPTRGLDVSSMETVRGLLERAAQGGMAVVLISEDLREILDLADRVAVICAGEIQGFVEAEGADVDEIGVLMMGKGAASGQESGHHVSL